MTGWDWFCAFAVACGSYAIASSAIRSTTIYGIEPWVRITVAACALPVLLTFWWLERRNR